MGRLPRVLLGPEGAILGLRRRTSPAQRRHLERYRRRYQHRPWRPGEITNPIGPQVGVARSSGGGEQDRPAGQRSAVLSPLEVARAVQAVESYEQAVRERRAHEWWGRRPTWRKDPTIMMLEGAFASGDPMRILEALEHLARLTGELPG
jgi:hypothetical protein